MTVKTTEEIIAEINAQFSTFGGALRSNTEAMTGLSGRVHALEQQLVAVRAGGGPIIGTRNPGWGRQVSEHARYKAFLEGGASGKVTIPIKAELTTPSGVEQRDLVAPQRDRIQG